MFASRRFIAASVALLTASTFAVADTAAAAGDTYVVRSGDSIYGIAYDQGVSVDRLMSANGLEITSVILPGQQLTIPGGATSTPNSGSRNSSPEGTYTIVAGDSLSRIASRHGITLASLLSANDLQISSLILPGQRLTIPGGGSSKGSTGGSPGRSGVTNSGGSTAAGTATYKVQPGDSLSGIASKHDVRLGALLSVNSLRITSVIHPGRLLKLPAGATVTAPAPAAPGAGGSTASSSSTHTVVAGNSLSGIAATYGVTLASLLAVNDMQVDSLILPGQQLRLPAGASAPTAAPSPAPTSTAPVSNAARSRIDTVVAFALAQVGKDYAFFTKGPDSFDCSGLTLAAYREIGIDLTHWSAAQANQGERVDLDTDGIRAGDLVFQQRNGSLVINHVGIAIDGERWVHAVGPGKGVRISALPDASTITTVRRYVGG